MVFVLDCKHLQKSSDNTDNHGGERGTNLGTGTSEALDGAAGGLWRRVGRRGSNGTDGRSTWASGSGWVSGDGSWSWLVKADRGSTADSGGDEADLRDGQGGVDSGGDAARWDSSAGGGSSRVGGRNSVNRRDRSYSAWARGSSRRGNDWSGSGRGADSASRASSDNV